MTDPPERTMPTLFNLTGKTAVVVGGASGIGRAISILFATQGAKIVILDIDEKKAQSCVSEIRQLHKAAETFSVDISKLNDVEEAIRTVSQSNKRIDVLVNSAGIPHIGSLETTSEKDLEKIFMVNVKGVFNAMKAVVPFMKQQGGGVILNIASVAASTGISNRFAYSMSKGAVLSMTYSVARDFIKDNIRCNSISPARIHTPFVDSFLKTNFAGQEEAMFEKLSQAQPIGRMGKPDEVASLALYLCSDEASFVTGCDYPIDGGFTKLVG